MPSRPTNEPHPTNFQSDPSSGPDEAEARRARRLLRRITITATIGALAFGYDTGVISGALPFMVLGPEEGGLGLNPLEEGVVSASLILGAAFGALFGGRLADRYGRRKNLIGLAVIFFFGALGTAFAPNTGLMLVARFILGLAVGGASATVPLFLAEFAPSNRRGRLVSQNELMIVTGQLLAYVTNAIIVNTVSDHGVWRIMLGVAAAPAAALFVGMLFVPESPRWLAAQGRFAEAHRVLLSVREDDPTREWKVLRRRAERSKDEPEARLRDVKEPWAKRILVIGIVLGIVFQLTGVNAVMYYAPSILEQSGLGTAAAITATIANGVVAVLSTFYGLSLVNRVSRRPMLMTGLGGIVVSQVLLGVTLTFFPPVPLRAYVALGFMLMFLFFMQALVAVVCWLMLAEIFPLKYRGAMMGVAVFAMWLTNTAVTFLFPVLNASIGGATFFVFAVFNFGSLLFVLRFLPETRGRTLEEFEEVLQTGAIPLQPGPDGDPLAGAVAGDARQRPAAG